MNPHLYSSTPSRRTVLRAIAAGSLAAIPGLAGCGGPEKPKAVLPPATLNTFGNAPADYQRLSLKADEYQPWEGGFRTAAANSDPKVYERWHCEFMTDDGTVVTFTLRTRPGDALTLNPTEQNRLPAASLIMSFPWGSNFDVVKTYSWNQFSSATDRCDVKVGPFSLTGDTKTFRLTGRDGDIGLDLTLTNQAAPFRPGTGVIFLGSTDTYYGWTAPVPTGRATGTLKIYDEVREFDGHGFHEHSWGNIPLPSVIERWKAGRGVVGDFAILGIDAQLRPQWGSTYLPMLVVDDAKNHKRLVGAFGDDALNATEFERTGDGENESSQVEWVYTGENAATVTMTSTNTALATKPYVINAATAQPPKGAANWYTRYEANISLTTDAASPGYAVTGKGTLDTARYGLLGPAAPQQAATPQPTAS
ncbi:hypothetical protein Cs7R123_14160 [Catellatospora sp. TT07R-123]|uniref:hypothetical protein n=1 Tax=Catellatospora sp. TT07R-123 TaxID=2733863 RepID=UPI001B1F882E|nr:hypothetical protein [Catellatospora sp. TT07R-123]GHJ44074.1 hypothetical protein Cs7R123_14160 [Catellatospora sp. TT07R-123]